MDLNQKIFVVGKDTDCNFNTIQDALNNVEENSIIQLKSGIYNEHLEFKKPVHIIGCNESIKDKSSSELPIVVFDTDKSCEVDVSIKVEGIVFTHKKDLQFENLTSFMNTPLKFEEKEYDEKLVTDEGFKTLLWVKSESNFSNIGIFCTEDSCITFSKGKSCLENSFMHHTYSAGIYISSDAETIIDNCMISDSNFTGLKIVDSSPTITNCKIFDNDIGIACADASPKIYHCQIEKNKTYGCLVGGNSNPVCSSCEIKYSYLGIAIGGSSIGLYEDLDVSNNEHFGIYISGTSTPKIDKCTIYDNVSGVYFSEQVKSIMNDCEIFSNLNDGIFITGDSYIQVENCSINNNGNGVSLCETSKFDANFCEIYKNDIGIGVYGSCSVTIENCVIHDCEEFAVNISGEDSTVDVIIKKCKIIKNKLGIITSAKKGSLQIKESEICEASDSGLQIVSQLPYELYENCDIHSNKTGVFIMPSYEPDFDSCRIYNNSYKDIVSISNLSGSILDYINNKHS